MKAALLLGLLAGAPAHADQAAFDRGVAASRAGDQAEATTAFIAALDAGSRDPAVYHGLGNALYRQDQLGPAIAAWVRGLQLDPMDGDLRANLAHARKQTQDRLDLPRPSTGPFFWQAAVSAAFESLLAGALVAAGLVSVLVSGLRRRRQDRPGRWLRWDAALLLALGLALGASAGVHATRPPPATVVVAEVAVRSALGAEGVDLFVLHEGAVVRTVERYRGGAEAGGGGEGAAVLIELPDARKGWVPASAVDIADPAAPFTLATGQAPGVEGASPAQP